MGIYLEGEVIRRTRESLGITQEELCDGICSVETLSRIENGKNMPSRANFEALMGRMGKSGKKYLPFIRSQDIEDFLLKEELERLMSVHDYQATEQKLKEMEERLNLNDPVNRQYVLRMRAIVDAGLGYISIKERREKLEEALACTIPDFSEDVLEKGMLNEQEMRILCNIAMTYMEEEDFEHSINILKKLEKYLETIHMGDKERIQRLVLSNLGHALGRSLKVEESQEVRQKALRLAKKEENVGSLASILYGMAYNDEILHREKRECLERMVQVYVLAESTGNQYMMKHVKNHIIEVYGGETWQTINNHLDHHHLME